MYSVQKRHEVIALYKKINSIRKVAKEAHFLMVQCLI